VVVSPAVAVAVGIRIQRGEDVRLHPCLVRSASVGAARIDQPAVVGNEPLPDVDADVDD
jgi:hypothetical protein